MRLFLIFYVLGVVAAIAASVLLPGCYAAHAAAPCADSGVMPMAGGSAVNGLRSRDGGSNPPTPTIPQCAGPIVASECYANLEDWLSR